MRVFAPFPLASALLAAALAAPAAAGGAGAAAGKGVAATVKECRAIAQYNALSKFATKAFIADCLAAAGEAAPHPRPLAAAKSGPHLASGT